MTSPIATLFTNGRVNEAFHTGWEYGVTSAHGVSDIPEAIFAGALGLRLGGVNVYEGKIVKKPYLGYATKRFDPEDILKSLKLMHAASWIALGLSLPVVYGMGFWVPWIR